MQVFLRSVQHDREKFVNMGRNGRSMAEGKGITQMRAAVDFILTQVQNLLFWTEDYRDAAIIEAVRQFIGKIDT